MVFLETELFWLPHLLKNLPLIPHLPKEPPKVSFQIWNILFETDPSVSMFVERLASSDILSLEMSVMFFRRFWTNFLP